MCNESVIISRNEYDLLKTNVENDNITINIGEYDRLKDRSNMLQLVCRILEKKEFCEDELRMILGIERRGDEKSDCNPKRAKSSEE